jgi:Right handed beta helix region
MSKLFSPLAAAGALLSLPCLGAAPALASSPVTFVSGKGADSGTCASPANPCRTFQFAVGETSPGGEIKALDPAPYGPVTITHSISITGVEGAGSFRTSAVDSITINAGPNDTINLSHLTLDGFKTANNGIVLNSGGSLTISHCTVRNFKSNGIRLQPAGNTTFLIADTVASNNGGSIQVRPQGTGSAQGTFDHVSANKNGDGIGVSGHAAALAVYSTAANNTGSGFGVGGSGAVLRLAHSAATGNATGVFVASGDLAESAGDNFIRGNGTDVSGTLTNVGTR